jgi:hypothetical protein
MSLSVSRARKIVEIYTESPIASVLVSADPLSVRTYAIRAEIKNTHNHHIQDYLLQDYDRELSNELLATFLEEVEFTQWPPTSRPFRGGLPRA